MIVPPDMTFFLLLLSAFLLGGIPFGLIIGKLLLGIDVRQSGSGNIGMTNVMRVGGKLPGVLTFLLDFGKGSLAVWLAQHWLATETAAPLWQVSLIAVITVCGHVFSLFLRFKGGKGVSTLFGVLAALNLPVGLGAAAVWLGLFTAKRISSLAALTMLAALPVWFLLIPWFQGMPIIWSQFGMFCTLDILLLYKHRDNIARLRTGQETQLKATNEPPTT